MKYVKLTTVFMVFCVIVLPSFTKENATANKNAVLAKNNAVVVNQNTALAKKDIDLTMYVWFDPYNDFLDLNLIDDECNWTGFDAMQYPPFTLQEKGFNLFHVYDLGFGLYIPLNPYCPDKILFSHP